MYPNTNLQPGQTSPQVKQLQEFLIQQGFSIPAGPTGFYGNQTKAAVTAWQQKNGVDNSSGPGYWGPRSIAVAAKVSSANAGDTVDPEQKKIDDMYTGPDSPAAKNPKIMETAKGGSTVDEIISALQTGDISGIKNSVGQPFSVEDQQAAMAQAMEDNRLFYEAQQAKDTADAERLLAQKQANYQDYLLKSGDEFKADRTALNQEAVNRGVLFSGGNAQRQAKLQSSYERDLASKQATLGRDVAGTASDLQYKYGNDAANKLSQYYKAGGNTYGLRSAGGDVGQTGLETIYNPEKFNFQGTENTARSANAQVRAANLLWNKGNKLLATGYLNQK